MNTLPQHPDSWKLLEFLQQASAPGRFLNYCDYIKAVLYHPQWGYYQREKKRIGRNIEADFYTSQSLGPVFANLVLEAASKLIRRNDALARSALKDFTFVEMGCEPSQNGFAKSDHPFGQMVHYGVNDSPQLSGACVVFSNELFDAQPFYRTIFRDGEWRELGVVVSPDGLEETILDEFSPAVSRICHRIPATAAEGYQLDLPLPAVDLLRQLAQPGWHGLFMALDYGKSWDELIYQTPQGSGRTYSQHRQSSDLLVDPGRRDITCHVCWTWLMEELECSGFRPIHLESQEAFFLNHAQETIERILTTRAGEFQHERQTLKHLLHPAAMGRQFQALWAYRKET